MKRYIKNGTIKEANKIIIRKDGMQIFNPKEEMILADGWVEYIPPTYEPTIPTYTKSSREIAQEIIIEIYNNRTDIPNNEALDRAIVIYDWDKYIGKNLKAGQVVGWCSRIYRVRQDISNVIAEHSPSLDTASLYEIVELINSGAIDDPIVYKTPMEIFNGKYYIEEDVLYLCTRDSGVALGHNLKDLVGIYVELV